MKYLKIRNWDKWQSYPPSKSQPPWIKLHRQLLREPEWLMLTDEQKGQLISLWIVAADRQGEIVADPELLRRQCGLTSHVDLEVFQVLGFIESDGSQLAANPQPKSCLDKTRSDQTREEKKESKNAARFVPPSIQEIKHYCQERKNQIDAEQFHAFYESKGWKVGNQKMKSWQSAVITWEKRLREKQQAGPGLPTGNHPSFKAWKGHEQT